MFTRVRDPWSFLGVSLGLVALYLVLVNSTGAAKVLDAGRGFFTGWFKTLQGR
jgi:hypothetical protein